MRNAWKGSSQLGGGLELFKSDVRSGDPKITGLS